MGCSSSISEKKSVVDSGSAKHSHVSPTEISCKIWLTTPSSFQYPELAVPAVAGKQNIGIASGSWNNNLMSAVQTLGYLRALNKIGFLQVADSVTVMTVIKRVVVIICRIFLLPVAHFCYLLLSITNLDDIKINCFNY